MTDAVIVSTARTAMSKSVRGLLNNTHGITLAGHALKHAIERAGLDPADVEDVILGCAYPEGATGFNIGRNAAMAAGCPPSTAGTTVNRYCSSGLQAIAMAAGRVLNEGVPVMAAGGVESISLVQFGGTVNTGHSTEKELFRRMPALWMTMIETAEIVAERYNVSRESQDEFALLSQQRTAAAQEAGRYDGEIVPLETTWKKVDKETKEESFEQVVAARDDCNRPDTTREGLCERAIGTIDPDNGGAGSSRVANPNGEGAPSNDIDVPIYSVDAVVRRATALQLTPEACRSAGEAGVPERKAS